MSRAVFWMVLLAGVWGVSTPHGALAQEKEGAPMPASVGDNSTVQFEYTLTVDGNVVDSSQGRGPMSYVHGRRQIVPGLERQMTGLHVGDSKEVTVDPKDAYGQVNPAAFIEIPKTQLPQGSVPEVGMVLNGRDPNGRPLQAKVSEVKETTVLLDMNHPLAGKTLHFKVKIINISPAAAPSKE
ncbi:MAG: peptidylprolyl isomerase [Candidatus Omnitrophica bacterium]|nr:peptidylprolyl isomerase [Candidatus Omnitrophota bacterium]